MSRKHEMSSRQEIPARIGLNSPPLTWQGGDKTGRKRGRGHGTSAAKTLQQIYLAPRPRVDLTLRRPRLPEWDCRNIPHKSSRVSSAGRLTDQEATLRDLAGRGFEGTTSPFIASYNLLQSTISSSNPLQGPKSSSSSTRSVEPNGRDITNGEKSSVWTVSTTETRPPNITHHLTNPTTNDHVPSVHSAKPLLEGDSVVSSHIGSHGADEPEKNGDPKPPDASLVPQRHPHQPQERSNSGAYTAVNNTRCGDSDQTRRWPTERERSNFETSHPLDYSLPSSWPRSLPPSRCDTEGKGTNVQSQSRHNKRLLIQDGSVKNRATTVPNINRRMEQQHQSASGKNYPQSLMQDIRMDFERNGEMPGHQIEEYEHPLMMNALPSLPGIDDHQRPTLHLAEMHEDLRQMRLALKTRSWHKARKGRPKTASPAVKENASNSLQLLSEEKENELSMLVRYFMSFGSKKGRKTLTLEELESAFRTSRRSGAFTSIEEKGKASFSKCLDMLKAHGLTPEVWIQELLSKNKRGGNVTTFDMGESIRAYNRTTPDWIKSQKQWLQSFVVTEKDIEWCLRYVDPDGNTVVDEEEVSNAVASTLARKLRVSFQESRVVGLIEEFERYMSANHMRLVDLFKMLDHDRGGTIDEDELKEFLRRAKRDTDGNNARHPGQQGKQFLEEKRERENTELRRKAEEAKKRLARAKESGAFTALDGLNSFAKTTGIRLSDLILATGAHPDGGMTLSQMKALFERANVSEGGLTREKLGCIMKHLKGSNGGLVSLRDIELALVQQTHDDILLKQLAKSLAVHMRNISHRRHTEKFDSRGSHTGNDLGSVAIDPSIGGDSNASDEVLLGSKNKPSLTMSGSGRVTTGVFDSNCEASTTVHWGPTTNAFDNYKWILEESSSIETLSAMEGFWASAARGGNRPMYHVGTSIPRRAFTVQAGSSLDSSWLSGFDKRFQHQRLAQSQRVGGGAYVWYTK